MTRRRERKETAQHDGGNRAPADPLPNFNAEHESLPVPCQRNSKRPNEIVHRPRFTVALARGAASAKAGDAGKPDTCDAQSAIERFTSNAYDLLLEGKSYGGRQKPGRCP